MKVAITGADGFLGRHLQVRLRAVSDHEVVAIPRKVLVDPASLRKAVEGVQVVVHLAGVNRDTPEAVETGNVALATRLLEALDATGEPTTVVYANSIHAGTDTPYGRGKQRSAELLADWAQRRGSGFVDIVFQNLFGEGGRPHYNSVVATFCHLLATGGKPQIDVDRPMELMHAQDAAALIINRLQPFSGTRTVETSGHESTVSGVLGVLEEIAGTYVTGRIPSLQEPFHLQLFNTYRSHLYPEWFPRPLVAHSDERGAFVEVVQSVGGEGQTSFSTTRPGITRGNHFHLRKVERFVVVKGQARIAIRPVTGTKVSTFDVSGETPMFVDMPTLATHNITNTGDDELLTLFWINEIFDPTDPDTFFEAVT